MCVKGVQFEIGLVLLALLDGQFASLASIKVSHVQEMLPNVQKIEKVGKLRIL